jgi:hypothetical protein
VGEQREHRQPNTPKRCGPMTTEAPPAWHVFKPIVAEHWDEFTRVHPRGDVVSARTGTAYAGIRTDLAQYALGAKLLAEGLGVRATARILEVDKGCIGKKGATYAAFFRGFTNVWSVSRSWAAADRWVAVVLTGSKRGV